MMDRKTIERTISMVKKEFSFRKPICPFISSTFQDFQEERDILMKKVFPQVDTLCRERGTYCAPIDLRWGISDAQVNQGLVIQLCLDYIQKCSPFFICLLGERYGCSREEAAPALPKSYRDLHQDADWLDKNFMVAASAGYDWILKPAYQLCSVTELEILQTAFIGNTDYCRFYFRQPDHVELMYKDLPDNIRQEKLEAYEMESEYKNLKVRDLKARIVKKGLPVKYFKTPQELADLVLEDWTAIVEELYPQLEEVVTSSYKERFAEWMAHETFAETRRQVFIKTPQLMSLMQEMTEFAKLAEEEPDPSMLQEETEENYCFSKLLKGKSTPVKALYQSILLLTGDRGCGKTSILANWVKEFQEEETEARVFSHYIGSSARSTDIITFMRRCTLVMRQEFPEKGGNESDMAVGGDEMTDFHHVVEAFQAALSLGPCVIIIDGVDELGESYGQSTQQVKGMSWLPFPLPPQCKVVLTTSRCDLSYKYLANRADCKTLRIPLITNKEAKRDIIEEYLAMHCKSLSEDQLDRIVACKLSDRPLFLAVLANELRVFGVKNRLDYHLDSYLEATSVRELWSRIILRWIKDYSWTLDTAISETNESDEQNGWVADALRLIAVSRHGLTQMEILDMLKQLGYDGEMEVSSLHWALFRSAAYDSLFERPGALIGFFHQHFKEAVEYTLLGSAIPSQIGGKPISITLSPMQLVEMSPRGRPPERGSYHKYIAEYLYWQPHSKRRTEELPWQLEHAKDMHKLCEVLAEPKMFLAMCGDELKHMKKLELLQYWNVLCQAGFSPTDTYWKMLKLASGEHVDMPGSSQEKYTLPEVHITSVDHESSQINGKGELSDQIPQIMTTAASTASSNEIWPAHTVERILDSLPSSSRVSSRRGSVQSGTGKPARSETPSSCHTKVFSEEDEETMSESMAEGTAYSGDVDRSTLRDSQDDLSDDGLTQEGSDGIMDQKEVSRLANSAGQFLAILGHYKDSEEMLISAHDRLNENYPLDLEHQQMLGRIQESIGNLYMFQQRPDDALHWYNKALDSINELLGYIIDRDQVLILLETKGRLLDMIGNLKTINREYREAEKMLLSAKHCMEKAGSQTGKASVQLHIGVLRMTLGEYEKAERYLRQSFECLERWYGKCHPKVSSVVHELATLLSDTKYTKGYNRKQAESLYRRALKMREQCFGSDHILVSNTLFELGKLLSLQRSQSVRTQAVQYLRRALDIRTRRLGANNSLTVTVRKVLSDMEVVMKMSKARTLDSRTLEIPYSTLSFHEEQLEMLERAASRAQSAKSTRTIYEHTASRSTETQRDDQYFLFGEEKNDTEEKHRVDDYKPKGSLTKTVSYSDQEVLKYNTQTDVNKTKGHLSRDMGHIDVNLRPQTSPYKQHALYAEPSQRSQLATPDLHSTFSHSRANSAVNSHSGNRPSSAVSTVEHRKKCYIPGPHTIDPENAYSISHGPHTSVITLLGDPEAPRYSAISQGICHTSAWYHIRGRYPTVGKPYPPKRSQKRISLQSNKSLQLNSQTSINSCPEYRLSMVNDSPLPAHGSVQG